MFSDTIIYADESGDHGLASLDLQYPVFVLALCLFQKTDYAETASTLLQKLKFRFFGHDMVLIHNREIRKSMGSYRELFDQGKRATFMEALAELVEQTPFTLIATVIRKDRLKTRYAYPDNPYSIALGFCLERAYKYLHRHDQTGSLTHLVVESRGKKEDKDLELEFRRICQGGNWAGANLPFEIIFADKQTNSTGLQLADLVAFPIGQHVLRPGQANRAYKALEGKFDRGAGGNILGCGLKVFP